MAGAEPRADQKPARTPESQVPGRRQRQTQGFRGLEQVLSLQGGWTGLLSALGPLPLPTPGTEPLIPRHSAGPRGGQSLVILSKSHDRWLAPLPPGPQEHGTGGGKGSKKGRLWAFPPQIHRQRHVVMGRYWRKHHRGSGEVSKDALHFPLWVGRGQQECIPPFYGDPSPPPQPARLRCGTLHTGLWQGPPASVGSMAFPLGRGWWQGQWGAGWQRRGSNVQGGAGRPQSRGSSDGGRGPAQG